MKHNGLDIIKKRKYKCPFGEMLLQPKKGYYYAGMGAYQYDPINRPACKSNLSWCDCTEKCKKDSRIPEPKSEPIKKKRFSNSQLTSRRGRTKSIF